MKNRKPNSRSRSRASKNSKSKVLNRAEQSQNPPEIIVLPDKLPDNKPNTEMNKPVETTSEDKPRGQEQPDKK